MFSQSRVNHERSNIIPISKNIPTQKEQIYSLYEKDEQYGLKQNVFDPFKSSPPNSFLLKLQSRLIRYNSFCKMDDMRASE